jgi:hypothetical protein
MAQMRNAYPVPEASQDEPFKAPVQRDQDTTPISHP